MGGRSPKVALWAVIAVMIGVDTLWSLGIRIVLMHYLGLNVLMVASTPSVGGHYLVDILAGLAVVPCAILVFRWCQNARSRQLVLAVNQ